MLDACKQRYPLHKFLDYKVFEAPSNVEPTGKKRGRKPLVAGACTSAGLAAQSCTLEGHCTGLPCFGRFSFMHEVHDLRRIKQCCSKQPRPRHLQRPTLAVVLPLLCSRPLEEAPCLV